jgi:centromere protein I
MDSKIALLNFYGSLLNRWILLMLSEPELPLAASSSVISLITHANTLALTIIQTSQTVNSCSAVLHFYETTASLISNPDLSAKIRIVIPSSELVYTLFFAPSLSNISRLCAVLTIYKRAFETAMGPRTNSQHSYPKDYVNHFNGFLMDLCNCLWRSRAFNTSDMNALGCLLPEPICNTLNTYVSGLDTSLSLPTLFNLSYSPFLCHFAISYVRELEDNAEDEIEARHAGPVTQASLKALERDGGISLPWSDYRLGVLQYLEKQGAPGIGELMYNTMKHLMNARENKT